MLFLVFMPSKVFSYSSGQIPLLISVSQLHLFNFLREANQADVCRRQTGFVCCSFPHFFIQNMSDDERLGHSCDVTLSFYYCRFIQSHPLQVEDPLTWVPSLGQCNCSVPLDSPLVSSGERSVLVSIRYHDINLQ